MLAAFADDVFVALHSREGDDVSQATAASLATFFKQIDLVGPTGVLGNYISFNTPDKRALWLKSSRKVYSIRLITLPHKALYADGVLIFL